MVKLLSWNVNGYRAVVKKGFGDWLRASDADVVCLQETKLSPEQIGENELHPDGYTGTWCASEVKKGYSGTACLHRVPPLAVSLELPQPEWRGEGRLIQLEFERFYLLNIYFPNGQMNPERLAYKLGYYDAFLVHVTKLRERKGVVCCGDFNTAHADLDLKNPRQNEEHSGFLPQERAWMDRFVASGFVDTFRMFEQGGGHYTWWNMKFRARERNAGWRIDYFFVSEELRDKVVRAWIEPDVMGSDHCPVGVELDVTG